jgi:hypothetical protein
MCNNALGLGNYMTKISHGLRFFGFFILAQFLNVQIQSAFATAAITAADPGVAQALNDLSQKVEAHYGSKSEERQLAIAYKFYGLANRLRNKVFHQSADEVQTQIQQLDQNQITPAMANVTASDEESEITQALNSDGGLSDLAPNRENASSLDHSQANRENLLKNSDPLLLDLGSSLNEDGTFAKIDFETFKANVFQIDQKQNHLRSPASMNNALKVILATLIIAIGLVSVVYILAITAVAIAFGSITLLAGIVIGLLTSGIIIGVIFAVKAISNAKNESTLSPLRFGLPS